MSTNASALYKYRNLPDIDTTAPDVYETAQSRTDLPTLTSNSDSSCNEDSDQDQDDRDAKLTKTSGDSDEIVKSSLRHCDATNKFTNATEFKSEQANFSDQLRKQNKRGKDAGFETSTYQLPAGEAAESAVDKLRRLKYETRMLEEMAGQKQQTLPEATGEDEVPVSELLAQLRTLKRQLAQLDSTEPGESLSEYDRQAWEKETKSLFKKLSSSAQVPAVANQETSPAVASSSNVGSLDRRMAELEEALGIKEALLDESKLIPKPILPTLQRLERQLQLLSQPRHLDAISRRVKVLVTELDRVHDSKRKLLGQEGNGDTKVQGSGNPLSPQDLTKLDQLFTISTRLDPLLPLVPSLLTRLHTLSDLHSSSAHFAKTLDHLEQRKTARETQANDATELIESVEKSLQENGERIKTNLESLEERMAQLAERVAKLA